MGIEVIIAKTHEEKEAYFELIRKVYCEEYGYLAVPYDVYDSIATHFLAVNEESLEGVAAMRIIEPNSVFDKQEGSHFGFPMEEEFDLSPLVGRTHERYVQVSKSAVPKKYQKTMALITLWRAVYQYIRYKRGYTHWLNSANPENNNADEINLIMESARERGLFHPEIMINAKKGFKVDRMIPSDSHEVQTPGILGMYERMNHRYIGEPAIYEKSGTFALPMMLEVAKIGNQAVFEKPGNYRY